MISLFSASLIGSNRDLQVARLPPMSENLSLVAWLGPTRHPPRSLLRALLVLVDLQDLRSYARETLGTSIMDSTTRDRIPYLFFLAQMKNASSPMPNMWNL